MADPVDVEEIGARIDGLLDRIATADPVAAQLADQLVGALLELHGTGLQRLVEVLRAKAPVALDDLADDVLVSGLLLLHGLQPDDVDTPLRRVLDPLDAPTATPHETFIPLDAVRRHPHPHPQPVPTPRSDGIPSDRGVGSESGAGETTGCQLCGAPTGDAHRHVVDLETRSILCTCRACGVLFTGGTDAHEHFRTVPDRHVRVEPFELADAAWRALQIPVGITFVIHDSRAGRPVAFFPSPAGATEAELPPHAWRDVVAANPVLADVEADVEAVLVRNERGRGPECHIVPVDRCYQLVGTLRVHWQGFDGGQEVREATADFFADLAARSRPATVAER